MGCHSQIDSEKRPFEDALLHLLGRCEWQLFCTLTFRDSKRLPKVADAKAAFFAWLRTFSKFESLKLDWRQISAVVRYEVGGINGRPHLHVLFTGLPNFLMGHSGRLMLSQTWSGVRRSPDFFGSGKVSFERSSNELAYGFADVQKFNASLPGVQYLFKPQTAFEFSRFSDRAQTLDFRTIFFTEALTRRLAKMAPSALVAS